jgi:hypothetical protein
MGEGGHSTGRGMYSFLWRREWGSSDRDRLRESCQRLGEWSLFVIRCSI